jgi:hypothetical protein
MRKQFDDKFFYYQLLSEFAKIVESVFKLQQYD